MPNRSPSFSVAVVLLAAGASSRMGKPKMLLPWGQNTILGHLIDVWKKVGVQQIAVVYAERDGALNAELDRLAFPQENRITNPDPARGMFSSIQCAAQWKGWRSGRTHWAIALGDQPHLPSSLLRSLLDFARKRPQKICQPSRNGRARHPVLLPVEPFHKLATATEENLKQFLEELSANVQLVEINDPALDLDLDTPADYEKARRLFIDRERPPIA